MPSIIEELYFGNIRPAERPYRPDSAFARCMQRKAEAAKRLSAQLNEAQKALLYAQDELESEIQGIVQYDAFTYGLKFGILLMAELFSGFLCEEDRAKSE